MDLSFFELLDLQKALRYRPLDRLGLTHLQPLRDEVDAEVERRCQAGKDRRGDEDDRSDLR